MKPYFIIEHKEVIMFRGQPILFNGKKIYRSKFVHTIKNSTTLFDRAKRFSSYDAAQNYIDKWLSNKDGIFTIKCYDY